MRPHTRFQHKVAAVNERLSPITEAQKQWGFRNALNHYAIRNAKGVAICLDCGHQWQSTEGETKCPKCGATIEIKDTQCRKLTDKRYFSIVTTIEGIQLQRVFRIEAVYRKHRKPEYSIVEQFRLWLDENSHFAVSSRRRSLGYFVDSFVEDSDIELRSDNECYHYLAGISEVYPRIKVLHIISRNGLHGASEIPFMKLAKAILTDSRAETMLKAGRESDLAYFLQHPKRLEELWSSYRITLRNGYRIGGISIWADYIALLTRLGKDTHNAHYVCPDNLSEAHDKAHRKAMELENRRERAEKRKKAAGDEARFRELKGRFVGICFTDGTIEVSVLGSVNEYLEESAALHHCCFASEYYLKPNSLCLSARVNGERTETVELSLIDFRVLQSRGLCNSNTPYHDRIIRLVESNANLFRRQMGA